MVVAARAERTTTSRSEWPARAGATRAACAIAALSFGFSAQGCRRETRRVAPVSSAAAVPSVVPEPSGLLFQGVIRRPGVVYKELQQIAGGRAHLLPANLSVAVATTLFDSPLSAGLVDDGAPVAVCILRGDGDEANIVTALALTSGRELVATLTTGADAKFTARADVSGPTVLTRRTPDPRVAIGVFGDRLLLSDSESALLAAGPFLSRSARPADDGAELELSATRAALEGPLASMARAQAAALRDDWLLADSTARQRHGGRAPDFGDPSAVVRIASSFIDGFVDVLASTADARLTATLFTDVPVARLELTPAATGAARHLTAGMATGRLDPLLTLPDWVEGAFCDRSTAGEDAGSPWAARFEAVLGDRLGARDRAHLRGFLADAAKGVGDPRIAGIFDDTAVGLFVLGPAGDEAALRRATLELPRVVASSAVGEPLRALFGRVDFSPAPVHSRDVAALAVRVTPKNGGDARPSSVDILTSSAGERVVVVSAHDQPAQKMRELLVPDATRTLAHDASVVSAVARAARDANAAALLRVRDDGGAASTIVVTFGSDRKVTWAEVGASKAALGAFVRAWIGR